MDTSVGPKIGLSNNQLKIIALICMLLDHVGFELFPNILIFRIIGRLSFPIFAYMIAEGCYYTKNRLKYLLNILGLGIICQLVFLVATGSLYQGILLTFSLSIILIYSIDTLIKKKKVLYIILSILAIIFVLLFSIGFPIIFKKEGFEIDYTFLGVLLPVLIYYLPNKLTKLIFTSFILIGLAYIYNYTQLYSLLAIPLLILYNGSRGKLNLKYLFYIFYPAHLVIIYLIKIAI